MVEPIVIGNATLFLGDAADVLPQLGPLDRCVSDPPYLLGGIFPRNRENMDKILAASLSEGFDETLITSAQFKAVVLFCHNDQMCQLLPYLKGQFDRQVTCFWGKSNPLSVAKSTCRPTRNRGCTPGQATAIRSGR
jgi:site-specific DNA-methyltransferase (adenine-specific)